MHLAVLVHGLWGLPKHLDYLKDTLRSQHSDEQLHILVAKSNSENATYDGIEIGGERVANEIELEIERLEKDGTKVTKISVTGYSLGGLISRYAIGLMYSSGLFERVQPVNFTTFATPHIGVRTPKLGYRSYVWNFLGARTLSTSGQQMFLVDNFRQTGRNLLSVMADPNSVFVKGLSQFKYKWIYANTLNDRSVPFHTAYISRTDPYVELDKIQVHYQPEQPAPGKVLLDPNNPVEPREAAGTETTFYQRFGTASRRTVNNVPFYLVVFSVLPLALPLFMVNAAYQSYQSGQRIRAHESGTAFSLDRYRIKLLEEAQAVQDRAYEHLVDHQRGEYLPPPPRENNTNNKSPRPKHEDSAKAEGPTATDLAELSRRESNREPSAAFPILALKKEQFDMIDSLDRIGITKHAVHIQKVRHTHAAIVVRTMKDAFAEGKVVVRHWAEKFEL